MTKIIKTIAMTDQGLVDGPNMVHERDDAEDGIDG